MAITQYQFVFKRNTKFVYFLFLKTSRQNHHNFFNLNLLQKWAETIMAQVSDATATSKSIETFTIDLN